LIVVNEDHINKSNTMKIIHLRSINRFPGDTAMELKKPATTDDGRIIPVGTIVQPRSAGCCGGGDVYQTVIAIEGPLAGTDGRILTFLKKK